MSDAKLANVLRMSFYRAQGVVTASLAPWSKLIDTEQVMWLNTAAAFRHEARQNGMTI